MDGHDAADRRLAKLGGAPRFSRRRLVGSSGVGLATTGFGAGLATQVRAQEATPMATPTPDASVGLAGLAFEDPEFDGQFLRVLDGVFYGCADIGECFVTARRVVPGDHDSWLTEWRATAERVYAAAEKSRDGGHLVSAREAFH